MESDSDSDGSHISATPPRNSSPPRPPPPRLPQSPASSKSRTKTPTAATTKSSFARPILRPKLSRKSEKLDPEPNPEAHQQTPSEILISSTPILTNLPFQIRQNPSSSTYNNASTETLFPNSLSFSKFASFSRTKNKNLNFEAIDSDPEASNAAGVAPQELGNDSSHLQNSNNNNNNSAKAVTKHPNLIGSRNLDVHGNERSSFAVKKAKCGNEGNFVRLNINGYGKKRFMNKGKKGNTSSMSNRGRRFYRSKRKLKDRVEGEESELLDEEGLVANLKRHREEVEFDMDIIEEAVMRVKDKASDENLVRLLKVAFGHDTFREGQLEAIKMVLSGKSTMLVLPTGAGKSLCYQLPAMIFPGVTLVVSPLVALMVDQLKNLCPAIPGALLSSSQTFEEAAETLRLLQGGEIKVLFVSPERLLNAKFVSIFSSTPLISLVVVDEAHCVSEWSHNFRPSYMRIRASLLRARLNAKCILAMTATATTKTLHEVMHALDIPPTNLIQSGQLRHNLQLSVSISGQRKKDLIALIKSSPFSEVKSIIIYCKFQYETDTISKCLCDNNIPAQSYHSGIPAEDRSRIQELFCSNKLRVVVATVAFGMGLDKSDVGAVIHYSLPESLEEYVQEIGRAGRDGRLSYCHLFFDEDTYVRLKSLMYSDGVDEYAMNKFLGHVFCNGLNSAGKICSVITESASRKFDMKEEVMLTILTQLELGKVQYLQLLPQMHVTCTLNFHQTSPAQLATKDIIVAATLKKADRKDGQYMFDIPNVANSIGLQAIEVLNHLQNLKLKGEVTYELKDQAFCYVIIDVPKDICALAAELSKWLAQVESCKVQKIDAMYNAALFAVKECDKLHGCHDCQHSYCLQKKIVEYFSRIDDRETEKNMCQNSPFLRADIKVFLQSNVQAKFTPRAIARIMHGLASPAFPRAAWSKTHFWGRYQQTDFKLVMEAAKAELMNFVGKNAHYST